MRGRITGYGDRTRTSGNRSGHRIGCGDGRALYRLQRNGKVSTPLTSVVLAGGAAWASFVAKWTVPA